jgi:hypothetical protein
MRQVSLKVQVAATRSCRGLGVTITQSYLRTTLAAPIHRIDGPFGWVAPQISSTSIPRNRGTSSLQQITPDSVTPDVPPADTPFE